MATPGSRVMEVVGLGVLALVIAAVLAQVRLDETIGLPDFVGKPLPPIMVEDWLNRPAGTSVDPHGRVVVLECWASWCGPCIADLPKMAKVAAEYEPLGVRFLSVTQETGPELPAVRQVIAGTRGFTWPVGYGAAPLFDALGVSGIPSTLIFGANGRCLWVGSGSVGLAEELDKALIATRPDADLTQRRKDG